MIGDALQMTATGREQFSKLISEGKKIQVFINNSDLYVNDKNEIQTGDTKAHFNVVETLDMKAHKKSKEADVQSAEITLFFAAISKVSKDHKSDETPLTFNDWLGVTFGHEIEHTTNENQTIWLNQGNDPYEQAAYDIGNKIIGEVKAAKKSADNKANHERTDAVVQQQREERGSILGNP
jgi:hypothetical protein